MKHYLVFASLISPSKMILFEKKYQTFDTVFHHQMKHLEVRQRYSAVRRIFNSLLGVSSGDETLHLMFDILLEKPYTACFFQVYLIMYEGGSKIFFNKRHFFLLFDLQFNAYSLSKQRLRLSYSTST